MGIGGSLMLGCSNVCITGEFLSFLMSHTGEFPLMSHEECLAGYEASESWRFRQIVFDCYQGLITLFIPSGPAGPLEGGEEWL